MFEPEEQPFESVPYRHRRWGFADLAAFTFFFFGTVLFFPLIALYILRIFKPTLQITDLSTVDQVLLQGLMDIVLVSFIFFMVKVVRGMNFLETIHWRQQYEYTVGSLVSAGGTLAITVLLVSALFPPTTQTPIEKMLSSAQSLYIFALFGVFVAPLFEEIIFRGFLYKVFDDMSGGRVAVPATAILFALLHAFQLWGNWPAVALIFAVGYVLAWLRYRSGSIIPGLIVHTSYNAMLFGLYAISALVRKGLVPGAQ